MSEGSRGEGEKREVRRREKGEEGRGEKNVNLLIAFHLPIFIAISFFFDFEMGVFWEDFEKRI